MKQYNISYVRNDVPQTILVEAVSAEAAECYFKHERPSAVFCGIHEATADDMKPGKPVMLAKTFEVWKDCELGQTYREEAFFTKDEADEWINKMERYYPGWHLRVVEVKE